MFHTRKKQIRAMGKMSKLFVIIALFSSLVLPGVAGAAPGRPVKITLDNVSVQAGQSVHVLVKFEVPDYGRIEAYNMQVEYDASALQIINITPTHGKTEIPACQTDEQGCFQSYYDNEAGWARVIWSDFTGNHRLTSTQQLFDIEIKAKSGTAAGTKQLVIDTSDSEHLSLNDSGYRFLSQLTGGTITITSGTTPVTPSPGPGSSTGGSNTTSPVVTPVPSTPVTSKGVDIYVNGQKQERSATAETATVENRVVTTVKVDNDKVLNQISDGLKTLLLPVSGTGANTVIGELNGKLIKAMENNNAELVIQTDQGAYTLPANQIRIDQISKQLGTSADLEDIVIQLTIAPGSKEEQAALTAAVKKQNNASVVASPVDFKVSATHKGVRVDIDQYSAYVERSINLPEGVDSSKITTGVVLLPDGSIVHVPTKIVQANGKYSAIINSLTNSTYALIYHPVTFDDVSNHWSRSDVQDLASRLIVQGTGENSFSPDRSITRAEFTAILLRGLGLHSTKGTEKTAFKDVQTGSWYENDVQIAVSYGLISGYADESFHPNGNIIRAEAMTIISRALDLVELEQASASETEELLSTFTDSGIVQNWAAEGIASAVKQGLVQGTNGKLMANTAISRSQTAVIVKRLLSKAGLI